MNAVFTIVAKNYFSLAKAMIDSIKSYHPEDLEFIIVIADELEDKTSFIGEGYELLLANSIGIEHYEDMSFKYDVTEFCTSVKPFVFEYLFEKENYEKLIYFDPDILIYNRLDLIFDSLESYSIFLTPHLITPEYVFTGNTRENSILFSGIFNLGFLALKKSKNTLTLLKWWKVKLEELCYADRFDGLFVDQKWMDFAPSFFPTDTVISHHLGLNVAYWNIHERKFIKKDNKHYLVNRINENEEYPLIFVHYSGVDPKNIYVNKQSTILDLKKYPDWIPLVEEYAKKVINFGFNDFLSYKYDYATYSNGLVILKIHRRFYRRMREQKIAITTPFNANGYFYKLLENNKLLNNSHSNLDKLNESGMSDFDGKVAKINMFFKLIKNMIGFEKYVLLVKFFQRYFRFENQTFLIKEYKKDYKYLKENI
jgi:hypothetical protein